MFKSKMHFLFSVRKKYVEKFNWKLDYQFFATASDSYDRRDCLGHFFTAIKEGERNTLLDKLHSFGIEIHEKESDTDEIFKIFNGRKEYVALFYDDEARFVGSHLTKEGMVKVTQKQIRGNSVWIWFLEKRFAEKIKDENKRERLLATGKAIGPYEIWFFWLNNTWK